MKIWIVHKINNPNFRLHQQKIKDMLKPKELKFCLLVPEAYMNSSLCIKTLQGPQILFENIE